MKIRTERDRFSTMKLACSGAMACAMLALTMGAPQAAGGHGGGADHDMPAGLTGQAADVADADRTVEIDLAAMCRSRRSAGCSTKGRASRA
ncbi:MAG: hypothetical protein RIB84_18470 [Sneathiellaceae bacterium]